MNKNPFTTMLQLMILSLLLYSVYKAFIMTLSFFLPNY